LHKNLPLTAALARLAALPPEYPAQRTLKWIAWCHDLAWINPLYAADLRDGWPWELLKTCLPNVTYVTISEQRQIEMARLFGEPRDRFAIVPNGISPARFLPWDKELASVLNKLEWKEREWVFLTPVRITRRKNLQLAIRIIGALRDAGHAPLLVITGPPGPHNTRSSSYMRELLKLRADLELEREVAFMSLDDDGKPLQVSDSLLKRLFPWADALLITSEQEGFGLPMLEAALARLPIFCTDLPVLREVGGNDAHYFDPDDPPHKVAQLITGVLEAPGVAAIRRRVMRQYTWDAIFRSHILPLLT
jgi:glycosyltransferase involved in cell wall biosynthesis